MVPINHRLIDLLRHSDGWRELVKYYQNEYQHYVDRSVEAKTEVEALDFLRQAKHFKRLLLFLTQQPKEER